MANHPPPPPPPPFQQPPLPPPPPPTSGGGGRLVAIAAAVVLVLAGAGVGVFLLLGGDDDDGPAAGERSDGPTSAAPAGDQSPAPTAVLTGLAPVQVAQQYWQAVVDRDCLSFDYEVPDDEHETDRLTCLEDPAGYPFLPFDGCVAAASDEQVDGETATVRVEMVECTGEPYATGIDVELALVDDVWLVENGTFTG